MKKQNSEFDYLQTMVREQIQDLQNLGPVAFEVLKALLPPAEATDMESLVAKVIEQSRPVVQVEPDMLNMRSAPGVTGSIVKALSRGSYLILADPESEETIGTQGRWLRVRDMQGSEGYVSANFVSKFEKYDNPSEKIDQIMQAMEYFSRLDLVDISRDNQNYRIALTSKGKYMAEILFGPA